MPVLTTEELLHSTRHKGLLRQFRDLAEVSPEDFDATYGVLLNRFMEFVQVLPHKPNGILGSLLNYGFARVSVVFQKYCQLRKKQTTPLLKFAVFSAALLQDLGRVLTNQRITLTNAEGEFLSEWNPFAGSMMGQSQFFKMYQVASSYLTMESEATVLFAHQLIPHDVFLWLSSDPVIFADWLMALLKQESGSAREITWILSLIKREDIIAILAGLDGASPDEKMSVATEYGEAFYQWLKTAIDKGEIKINTDDAGLHVVSEGVLIEKKLFKQFADLTRSPVNFVVVYNQMGNLMGIASKGGNDFLHAQYFSRADAGFTTFTGGAQKGGSLREGMVVSADRVFIQKEIPGVSASLKSVNTMIAAQQQKPVSEKNNAMLLQNKRT